MSSAADLLDTMAKARDQLRAAEREEAEARKVLRAAQEKLKAANKRYSAAIDEALDEKKKPGLPFDEATAETKAALQLAVAETKPAPAIIASGPVAVEAPTKGEPIEPLGLTAAELDKAVCPGKIGRAGDKPKALPVVTVNGRPHVVVAGAYPAASSGRPTEWKIRPIWTAKEFPSRYAGELSESVQRSDIYLGVKVLVGKGKAAIVHVVGPKHEERKLIEFVGVRVEKKPTAAPVAEAPPSHEDETATWLRRAEGGAPGTGQDPKRLKEQIAEFRADQEISNAHAMWNHWSEFFVPLLTDGRDAGERVRVLAKPEWDGEKGRHHIEFWHSRISETGYWSIVTTKAGAMLSEWCREHIQKQADAHQAERSAKKPAKQPSLMEAAKGAGYTPEQVAEAHAADLVYSNAPKVPEIKPVTRLAGIPNIPDAVLDALLVKGTSTLPTLLERADEATPGVDLPLRNKLVAYMVSAGVKLKPAENAADAIAAHVAKGDAPPVKIIDVLNLPKPKRVRKPKAVAQ